jgi:hypothetical protein
MVLFAKGAATCVKLNKNTKKIKNTKKTFPVLCLNRRTHATSLDLGTSFVENPPKIPE